MRLNAFTSAAAEDEEEEEEESDGDSKGNGDGDGDDNGEGGSMASVFAGRWDSNGNVSTVMVDRARLEDGLCDLELSAVTQAVGVRDKYAVFASDTFSA